MARIKLIWNIYPYGSLLITAGFWKEYNKSRIGSIAQK
jgi:hypothetical protein